MLVFSLYGSVVLHLVEIRCSEEKSETPKRESINLQNKTDNYIFFVAVSVTFGNYTIERDKTRCDLSDLFPFAGSI